MINKHANYLSNTAYSHCVGKINSMLYTAKEPDAKPRDSKNHGIYSVQVQNQRIRDSDSTKSRCRRMVVVQAKSKNQEIR